MLMALTVAITAIAAITGMPSLAQTAAPVTPGINVRPRRAPSVRHGAPSHRTVKSPALPMIIPSAGLVITSSSRLKPGVYHMEAGDAGAIEVTGKGITLDCTGVRLVGSAVGSGKGTGLRMIDAADVVIRGLSVSAFHWGIIAEKSTGVYLEGCVSSLNGDLPVGTVIDESGRQPQDTNGGGFLLRDDQHCRVIGCSAEHEWDGLDVVRCTNNTFRNDDFSYLNNWGLHLWDSSHNTFQGSRAIWCTTGEGRTYQGTSGWQTYDAEAICVEHSSSYNLIRDNDLRYGGDGVFIRANEGPATSAGPVPPLHPSNNNVIEDNDCSFSPNNAIEADFCDGNQFIDNNCSYSNYGFWLGYSRRNYLKRNTVVGCSTRALEIENGQNDTLQDNTFVSGKEEAAEPLILLRQNGRDKTPSGPYKILANVFMGSVHPVQLIDTPVTASGNRVITASTQIFSGDQNSPVTATGETATVVGTARARITKLAPDPLPVGGTLPPHRFALATAEAPSSKYANTFALPEDRSYLTVTGTNLASGDTPALVEVDGVAAMVVSQAPDRLVAAIPHDFWNRGVLNTAPVRVFNGAAFSPKFSLELRWTSVRPRIESVTPASVAPGTPVTVIGTHLQGRNGLRPTVYLDGKRVRSTASTPNSVSFAAPPGLLTTRHYHLVVRAIGESVPFDFSVTVPPDWEPHILSGTFTPTTLAAGELLHFQALVKNNAPFTLPAAEPGAGEIYDEKESYQSQGIPEKAGFVYVRVTSDLVGGGWPYLFGLPNPLPPGETELVEGAIRVETPGKTNYRMGLVDGRVRWIDNNLYNTPITVTPVGH